MSYAYDIFGVGTSFNNKESLRNRNLIRRLNSVQLVSGNKVLFDGVNNNPLSFSYEPEWEALGEFLPVSDFVKVLAGGSNTAEIGLFSTQWMKGNSYVSFDIESRVFSDTIGVNSDIINTYMYILNLVKLASKQQYNSVSYAVDQIIAAYKKQFDALIGGAKSTIDDLSGALSNVLDGNFSAALNNVVNGIKDFLDTYWNTLLAGFKGKTLSLRYFPVNGKGFTLSGVIIKNVSFTFSQDFVLLSAKESKGAIGGLVDWTAAPRYIDFKITLQTLSHTNARLIGGLNSLKLKGTSEKINFGETVYTQEDVEVDIAASYTDPTKLIDYNGSGILEEFGGELDGKEISTGLKPKPSKQSDVKLSSGKTITAEAAKIAEALKNDNTYSEETLSQAVYTDGLMDASIHKIQPKKED